MHRAEKIAIEDKFKELSFSRERMDLARRIGYRSTRILMFYQNQLSIDFYKAPPTQGGVEYDIVIKGRIS
jgi:hypothetical protein